MHGVLKHPQAKLYPSELVTIGRLCALKGVAFRAFDRWLRRDSADLFGPLPDRTRLLRSVQVHQAWTDRLLAEPSCFTVIDTYDIELIHPRRAGRSPQQVGRKGLSNKRWIVGIKLCWLVNERGQVVVWDWNSANVCDNHFAHVLAAFDADTIILGDSGFACQVEQPANLKVCPNGVWNERMLIDTMLRMVTQVCHLNHLTHRLRPYIEMRLASVTGMVNALLALNRRQPPEQPLSERLLPIAQYAF